MSSIKTILSQIKRTWCFSFDICQILDGKRIVSCSSLSMQDVLGFFFDFHTDHDSGIDKRHKIRFMCLRIKILHPRSRNSFQQSNKE